MQEILLIDDEPLVLYNLSSYFEDEGYEVYKAINGQEALDILQQHPNISVAIVDLKMPIMSGEEFIEKAFKEFKNLRYIIHTSSVNYDFCDSQYVKKYIPKNQVQFKPVNMDELKKLVDQLIKKVTGRS